MVLERPGYYTVPSLDEIDSLVSDGQCIVEGLTIGRRSFGRIHFPGNTDIYGLDLDALGPYTGIPPLFTSLLTTPSMWPLPFLSVFPVLIHCC